jgi:hypothetical protein
MIKINHFHSSMEQLKIDTCQQEMAKAFSHKKIELIH